MSMYLVPVSMGLHNGRACVDLIRECYGIVKGGLAPLLIGLIYETAKPIPEDEQRTLGVLPWTGD